MFVSSQVSTAGCAPSMSVHPSAIPLTSSEISRTTFPCRLYLAHYGVIKLNALALEGFKLMFKESNWASSHFYLNMVMFYDYFMNIFYGFLLEFGRDSLRDVWAPQSNDDCLSQFNSLQSLGRSRESFNALAHKSGLFAANISFDSSSWGFSSHF